MTASVTALYVILILAVHPIIYQDYYFNILNVKYLFYCACTIGMLILLGGYFFYWTFKQNQLKLIPTDYAFLAFIVIATLPAAFSVLNTRPSGEMRDVFPVHFFWFSMQHPIFVYQDFWNLNPGLLILPCYPVWPFAYSALLIILAWIFCILKSG